MPDKAQDAAPQHLTAEKDTSPMQHQTFTEGGFVLHKVATFNGTTTFSAWFNSMGDLLDMERRDSRKPSRLDRAKAAALGQIYRPLPARNV